MSVPRDGRATTIREEISKFLSHDRLSETSYWYGSRWPDRQAAFSRFNSDVPVVGRGEPFESFVRREGNRLVGLAYALSGSRSAADDLAQDALLAAYRNWEEVGRLDNPGAWVRRVVANRAAAPTSATRPAPTLCSV